MGLRQTWQKQLTTTLVFKLEIFLLGISSPDRPIFPSMTLQESNTDVPKNIALLLSLGLKFIPVPRTTPKWNTLDVTCVKQLQRDIALQCHFAGTISTFKPDGRMYVASPWNPPPWSVSQAMKGRLASFIWYLEHNFQSQQKKTDNLLPHQHETLRLLQKSNKLLVVQCDKNLGPALIEHNKYVFMVWRDHLSDRQTYL